MGKRGCWAAVDGRRIRLSGRTSRQLIGGLVGLKLLLPQVSQEEEERGLDLVVCGSAAAGGEQGSPPLLLQKWCSIAEEQEVTVATRTLADRLDCCPRRRREELEEGGRSGTGSAGLHK